MTMPQYWIQTPVENAKEVVQRYLDANSGTLTGYVGATVSYDEQCEVILYKNDFNNFGYDLNTLYFGNLVVGNLEQGIVLSIFDSNDSISIIDSTGSGMNNAVYKGIIWNNYNGDSLPNTYFIGYKFNITTP